MQKRFAHGNRRLLHLSELEANLAALVQWNWDFEIPDVISFADFDHSRQPVAESLFASQDVAGWGPGLRFPYPNGPIKLRELVVLNPRDLTLLRASAGRIARAVERRLSPRSFGSRTMRSGAAWWFCDVRTAWRHFTDSAIGLLHRNDINAMCATDIASYYPSIDLDRLETRLHDIGCDLHAVAVTLSGLRKWAAVDEVVGIPIGPEASGVLGNAFLIPVDRMLMSLGAEYLRWMDDYKVMARDEHACRSLVEQFDQFLRTQGLTRSAKKTSYYDNSLDAIAALRDPGLASLGSRLALGTDRATDELRAAFDREIVDEDEVSRSQFHYIVRALGNRGDDYAAGALASNPDLANTDPKLSGEYLGSVGLRTPAVIDAMLSRLATKATDRTDALHLHWLRALASKPGEWGSEEGHLFRVDRRGRFATTTGQMLGGQGTEPDKSMAPGRTYGERRRGNGPSRSENQDHDLEEGPPWSQT